MSDCIQMTLVDLGLRANRHGTHIVKDLFVLVNSLVQSQTVLIAS